MTTRWRSNNFAFATRNIPLVHQLSVAQEHQRKGVATLLMGAAEDLARTRGIHEIGITVGVPQDYGPAQRLYAKRGYIPDGRGVCRGREQLTKGSVVTINDDSRLGRDQRWNRVSDRRAEIAGWIRNEL